MTIKKWRTMPHENCPVCGDDGECFTDSPDGLYTDNDDVRCISCHYPGWICCDEDNAYVSWADEGYAPEAAEKIEELEDKIRLLIKLQRFSPRTQDGNVRMTPSPTGDVVLYHQLMEIINA